MQKIAEQLLNRALSKRDGIALAQILKCEKRLGFELPSALRDFYLHLGNNVRFSQAFSRFVAPEDLTIEYDKLIFLAENQEVCFWAIDFNSLQKQSLSVYQTQDGKQFYSENIDLDAFIHLNLYYQLAQGGYAYCATIDVEYKQSLAQILQLLATDKAWQKVVDHNHLLIYCNKNQLIWYFTNQDNEIHEMIFASTLLKKDLKALIRDFGFDDLG